MGVFFVCRPIPGVKQAEFGQNAPVVSANQTLSDGQLNCSVIALEASDWVQYFGKECR